MKSWSKSRKAAYDAELRANKAKLDAQREFMRKNQDQIDTLNRYKDDMERDKAVLGEQLVEKIAAVQIAEGKLAKRAHRIAELEAQLAACLDKHPTE